MKKIVIAGSGGFAKEVLTIIQDLGRIEDFEGFIEPDNFIEKAKKNAKIMGFPVLKYSQISANSHEIYIGVGNSDIREKIYSYFGENYNFPTLIHPTAQISPWVKIGKGAIICAGSILTCDIKIGIFCQLNLNTTIGHDCVIGNYFTTAPNSNISGDCTFKEHVYFGTSSAVKQGIKICNRVTIGMGAIVTKNITEKGIYIGNPAKPLIKKI